MQRASVPVTISVIPAGKLRRYQHFHWYDYALKPSIIFGNLVDIFKVAAGFIKSVWIIKRWKPDAIFAKGGYVCLPMGWAARVCRVPLVLHDSDARPGLTNRLLARYATVIATGYPLNFYNYPPKKAVYTGVPIDQSFQPTTPQTTARRKEALGYKADDLLVVALGGGLGATSINNAMIASASKLETQGVKLYIIAGKQHGEQVRSQAKTLTNVAAVDFIASDMAEVLGAADVVVTRASATALQELAGLGQTCVIVPSFALGDQQKNAQLYKEAKAGVVLSDKEISQPDVFYTTIQKLLHDKDLRRTLQRNIHAFWRPNAARDVAELIHKAAKKKRGNHGS